MPAEPRRPAFWVDYKPFHEYTHLPEIAAALEKILSRRHTVAHTGGLGVLLEPAERPWCTNWHRDWGDHVHPSLRAAWEENIGDVDFYNQVNCALYEDTCTWVVPGSKARLNTAEEIAAMGTIPSPGINTSDLDAEAAERACLNYCQSMPGAQRLLLNAGDFCLYRSCMWHLGNYHPYKRRATLHDFVDTPRYIEFRSEFGAKQRQSKSGAMASV